MSDMNKIKELREQTGKSQAEIAEEVGISRETMNAIENGRRNLVSRHLDSLSLALGASPVTILGYDSSDPAARILSDEHSGYEKKIKALREQHANEMQTKAKEISDLKDLLDQTRHSLKLAEEMNAMLQNQLKSLEKNTAVEENM